jgi:hypothetical protein
MTSAWFIDGLDARAGLAFTSLRTPDLLTQAPALDLPGLFIAPPTFRPETVSNRALAFAGTRGPFQYGLFIGEQEVAFPSLDAVIEFVRRAYLRGGGGDAAGGGGGGIPPRPTPGELDPEGGLPLEAELPREGEGSRGRELIKKMLNDSANARSAASYLKFHPGETIDTQDFHSLIGTPGTVAAGDAFVLARAAAELIAELLRRCPVTGPDDKLVRWFGSAQRLGRSINKLGLWHQLVSDRLGSNLARMADNILKRLNRSGFLLSKDAIYAAQRSGGKGLLPLLFCGGGMFPPWEIHPAELEYLIRTARSWPWPLLGSLADTRIADPVDDLAQWPLPGMVEQFVGRNGDALGLYNLFCAVVASPDVLANGAADPASRRAAEIAIVLVLFAAAHLVAEAAPSLAPSLVGWADEMANKALADVVQRALAWMADQYPNKIFPAEVEELIRSTSRLAYA